MPTLDEILERDLKPIYGFKPKFRLRWCFDFANKPTRYGGWNDTRQLEGITNEMAWTVNKDGLIQARIQGEKLGEGINRTLFEMDGHEYSSARWVTAAAVGGWWSGTKTVSPTVIGLTMIGRDKAATIYVDGTGSMLPLTEYEKKHKIKEHSI